MKVFLLLFLQKKKTCWLPMTDPAIIITGRSGCGKSTLLRQIVGLLPPAKALSRF